MAEWLRRWTANPLCSARVGSSPILIEGHFQRGVIATFVETTSFNSELLPLASKSITNTCINDCPLKLLQHAHKTFLLDKYMLKIGF